MGGWATRWSDYTGVNPYDQDGVTGWLAWAYVPTGKLSFNTRISYDTQANSVFTSVGDGSPVGAGPDALADQWPAVHCELCLQRQDLASTLRWSSISRPGRATALPAAKAFDDTRNRVTNLLLGATWLPSRNWQVNCNLTLNDRNQSRSSNQPISLLPYTAYGGSCSAQFVCPMKRRTVLLTGATGYIASHTWLALLSAGYRVVGVDNFSNSSPEVLNRLEHAVGSQARVRTC